ncbi:MAG: bifunctional demethylmenaquinone methyltransferase/2-methoxy-6-polyprenyl-1,4-benzoquinol methylase UbiE [Candidatus Melainabacteria bacterium]|jgi:demethylmenaquinone methyltransferase/2-methoxy-6-polyprenyl-1,4-benzoquinol methylase|uniref:Demethylmenaquinone methyltransferase n=1 Tax=Candidatus Obscuribacter phosphatis TaxID=1906157 RepID=A0A8J7P8G4_9BACT|nr:bifunctional demethylmenaquinone methyltransferase/2-methoxy-6-polyprenyl-1,4-benzoquinol methylase UbiE [Candidatus Obscuribacter phosphatis]MCA0312842.1 bifunctional demethylmenaquinone methyltransferase/2-methoxy-6-polyprenyl-1,4-benzoquinol methylase UbiE [Candidatus Melainabacteria bacterium]OPZ87016.1 MAG: Demethylmenaquinone methyltransferase [bacterium ADurb.Bin425]
MSFQLPTLEEKSAYVHDQFERIAKGYDLSNDVISLAMHRAWKMRAVSELVDIGAPGRFLDVCCGTGDLSLLIARMAAPGSLVTGLDFSQNMLDIAGERNRRKAHKINEKTRIDFVRGDAQNLPFEKETFNGAIISFGLRNLTDLQKGLNEMARVVKSGGKVANLDLGHCEVPVFAPIFSTYFGRVVPVIGGILQNDRKAYTYLPESLHTYPRPERISAMFEEAGLTNVRHIPLALGTVALHIGTKR